jgi:uncharacterized protein (TIGR02284 family)
MSTATAGICGTVNKLIEACLDGEQGFEAAANAVNDPELKIELIRYSRQRLEFAGDLQRIVASMGEEPASHGSAGGAMHRGWMNLKQAFTGDNRHAVLAECERGEDMAVKAYRRAMEEPLPEEVQQTIDTQYREILQTHDRVKSLRDAAAGRS